MVEFETKTGYIMNEIIICSKFKCIALANESKVDQKNFRPVTMFSSKLTNQRSIWERMHRFCIDFVEMKIP